MYSEKNTVLIALLTNSLLVTPTISFPLHCFDMSLIPFFNFYFIFFIEIYSKKSMGVRKLRGIKTCKFIPKLAPSWIYVIIPSFFSIYLSLCSLSLVFLYTTQYTQSYLFELIEFLKLIFFFILASLFKDFSCIFIWHTNGVFFFFCFVFFFSPLSSILFRNLNLYHNKKQTFICKN